MSRTDGKPEPVDLHVGARIRLRRKLQGISQQQLADKLGLTFQQLHKYEAGQNRVSASKLYELSRHLNTSVGYFFEGVAADGSTGGAAERAFAEFMATPEGLELASLFPRVKYVRARRRLFDFMYAMVEDEAEAALSGATHGAERPARL